MPYLTPQDNDLIEGETDLGSSDKKTLASSLESPSASAPKDWASTPAGSMGMTKDHVGGANDSGVSPVTDSSFMSKMGSSMKGDVPQLGDLVGNQSGASGGPPLKKGRLGRTLDSVLNSSVNSSGVGQAVNGAVKSGLDSILSFL